MMLALSFWKLLGKLTIFFIGHTAQKMKFSIKDFFSKCDQIRSLLRIWSYLLKKSLLENFIFCVIACPRANFDSFQKEQPTNPELIIKENRKPSRAWSGNLLILIWHSKFTLPFSLAIPVVLRRSIEHMFLHWVLALKVTSYTIGKYF